MKIFNRERRKQKVIIHNIDNGAANLEISKEEYCYKKANSRYFGLITISKQELLRVSGIVY